MELKSTKKIDFTSGDLLEIKPQNENRKRLYSVGKIGKTILLSVRKHEFGVCSTFLNDLNVGNQLQASIQINENFHFPKKAKSVILIANGTGIAPFLGMINKHKKATKVHLFWGIRTQKSIEIHQKHFDKFIKKNALASLNLAFSREQEKKIYVQDLLLKHEQLVLETLKNDGVLLICGSLAMQKSVIKTIEDIVQKTWQINLDEFIKKGQIKMDCY
jgi:sulfite reductase (NADPH) flavoprotein alpha-component